MTTNAVSNGWTAGTDETGGVVVVARDGQRWYPGLAIEVQATQMGDAGWQWMISVARRESFRGTWGPGERPNR